MRQMRPGGYDIHERVKDMSAGGVLACMCFASFPSFSGRIFLGCDDKDLAAAVVQAYNDWHIDEWCAAYPGRFIPLGIVPMWDGDLAVNEVHRLAKKGFRSISFLEAPHAQGFPSCLSGPWHPMLTAMSHENLVLSS